MEEQIHKLVIIGSGPAGYTAALYAARAELAPLIIAGQQPGGQLTTTTEVENFPGFPDGIQGPELMDRMQKQVERFGVKVQMENVIKVDFASQPFSIVTDRQTVKAQAVIIATGAEAKWLGLESEQRLRGKGVSACATCDGFFFKGKEIVVVGGGDSAMEEATFLTRFASKVYLVHRKAEFKASKIMQERVRTNAKIEILTPFEIVEVLGETSVSGVKLKHSETGAVQELSVGGLFLAIGHTPATKIFQEAGIEVDDKGYIIPKQFTETNIPGIFVAGDVHDHRYRQAVTAAGEGCKAALDAERWLSEK